MDIRSYISNISKSYSSGRATEHTYRGDLAQLIETIIPGIKATNEPKRQECGAPDYILTNKNNLPVGYIEAKDIGINLRETEKSEQLNRYKESLDNLILTDYLEFRFYRNGEKVHTISIAEADNGKITPLKDSWDNFELYLKEFCTYHIQSITSPEQLAKMMAGKARLMKDIIYNAVTNEAETTLKDQLDAFKKILIHDMDESTFADIYAQTIAYGLFAARLNDDTPETFSRQEALQLVPQSNPFLKKLFGYIAGFELDDRLVWIVDALAEVFGACNLQEILKNFGRSTQTQDPMLHFYETFLKEYDSKLRKSRGVYYTPEPVVNFIVRAVDDILKSEFNLPKGLADTSKAKIQMDVPTKGGRTTKIDKEVHKVQILDPATGTGTFLAEVVRHIYSSQFEKQQGMWSNYVEEHLLPRLHGFEILMASYTMCHLKLEMLLKETGYKPKNQQRLQVYLTNSLEEPNPYTGTIFASWLSQEAAEANYIKRESPVMVVLGNPPYAVSSTNKNEWIQGLIADYKKDLNERKINLDDDYIKFVRYGEYFIEKNGEGILAYISNNSFIDGITHRQMRKHLLETFDKIYILDLHGNSKKKETAPDGSKDENVFDIQQGVSINIFVKTRKKRKGELAQIFHTDVFGKRDNKYNYLIENKIESIYKKEIKCLFPGYFFVPKNFGGFEEYGKCFKIDEIIPINTSGIKTHHDGELVSTRAFKTATNQRYFYRPFDVQWIDYDLKKVERHRYEIMKHMLRENLSLITVRQYAEDLIFNHVFIANTICDIRMTTSNKGSDYVFPLYLYPQKDDTAVFDNGGEREPNLNMEIVQKIADGLGLKFAKEKVDTEGTFAPIDLLDYIYAVLHNPSYRDKYKEFLKIDFPRIPYPEDVETFWKLVSKGGELRQIHLMESPILENHEYYFPVEGNNEVDKPEYKGGRVYINKDQYFENVPEISWNFYIGGYQPAQKWLKDRKGRVLTFDDIQHYQKIIKALLETDRVMREIDTM
ncbi:MAG TPA: N-6 DNA methylase [bacterium]|nr:N-6 DNA methylase [bacterium]